MAAVLPCYWIYREVGRELLRRGSPEPLYQRWIDTYGGDEFDRVVEEAIALTEAVVFYGFVGGLLGYVLV